MNSYVRSKFKRKESGGSLRGDHFSPLVKRKITHLKECCNIWQKEVKNVEQEKERLADALKNDLSLDETESRNLVNLLKEVLHSNPSFNKDTFIFKLIQQQLICLKA